MTAVGDLSAHGTDLDWPTINPMPLSSYEYININTETRECYEQIQWLNPDQQIQASYVKVSPEENSIIVKPCSVLGPGVPLLSSHGDPPELLLASSHTVRTQVDQQLLVTV